MHVLNLLLLLTITIIISPISSLLEDYKLPGKLRTGCEKITNFLSGKLLTRFEKIISPEVLFF